MIQGKLEDLRQDKAIFIEARDSTTKLILEKGQFKNNPAACKSAIASASTITNSELREP